MKNRIFYIAAFIVLIFQVPLSATENSNTSEQQRALELYYEIRCVVCDGQSIADSNAEIAAAMRGLIQEKIVAGWDDKTIKNFLRERYGDGIFFTPPVALHTYVLWFGPLILLLAGIILIRKLIVSKSPSSPT